jgi:hypothetical protein
VQKSEYTTLQSFINYKKYLLETLLQDTAPLRRKEGVIGVNITWRITEGVDSARDYVTGQEIAWDLELFSVPLYVVCPGGMEVEVRHGLEEEYVELSDSRIRVSGTRREVFESIQDVYKPYPDLDMLFEGLTRIGEGVYLLKFVT